MSRPCSSHVYHDRPTPASCATSSRRSPGVRRRPLAARPTSCGVTCARRVLRKSVSSERRASEGGGASPTISALLVAQATVAHPERMPLNQTAKLGDHDVRRIGFGAMQLAGPGVFGPPRDRGAALAVLRRAVELGVDHIDTSQYYGPDVVNELIREALHPYPEGLRLVTKVGARRDDRGAWLPALRPAELRAGVEDNLRTLGIDRLTLVNLRLLDDEPGAGDVPPLAEMLGALEDLRREGKLEHIGLSNVSARHIEEGARPRLGRRRAEPLLGDRPRERRRARALPRARACVRALLPARQRLHGRAAAARGGPAIAADATKHGATPAQMALAWLLHRD